MTYSRAFRGPNTHLIAQAFSLCGAILVVVGGMLAVDGAMMPWARAELFASVPIAVPGIFFVYGGIAGSCGVAALIFRRSPLLCIALGMGLIFVTGAAMVSIPHSVRGELIGAQLSLSPLNQLLDQFHIDDITVGNYGAKDDTFLGEGIVRTAQAGDIVLLGGLIALLGNPTVHRIRRRITKCRCKSCSAAWPLSRDALYCPNCATPTPRASHFCANCRNPILKEDRFCVQCGTEAEANNGTRDSRRI